MLNYINVKNDSPNQTFASTLDGQDCSIALRTIGDYLYASLSVGGVPIFDSVRCTVWQELGYPSNDFSGSLFFIDNDGNDDPTWKGLGERWYLCYASHDDEICVALKNREVIKQWQK